VGPAHDRTPIFSNSVSSIGPHELIIANANDGNRIDRLYFTMGEETLRAIINSCDPPIRCDSAESAPELRQPRRQLVHRRGVRGPPAVRRMTVRLLLRPPP
jgi:hypothetical protein